MPFGEIWQNYRLVPHLGEILDPPLLPSPGGRKSSLHDVWKVQSWNQNFIQIGEFGGASTYLLLQNCTEEPAPPTPE